MRTGLPPESSSSHRFRRLSEKTIFLLSGDPRGEQKNDGCAPTSNGRTSPDPSCATTLSAYAPEASEKYAIDVPSGDQAGSRSATPDECVRLRMSPCFSGTVRISPRDSKSA